MTKKFCLSKYANLAWKYGNSSFFRYKYELFVIFGWIIKEIGGNLVLDVVYILSRFFYKKTKNDKNDQFGIFNMTEKGTIMA